jgi:NADH-quinone oxidoreductase subunit L
VVGIVILALLQAAPTEALAQETAVHAFEPTLLGWIVLLPLIGFLVNGAASLVAARREHLGRMAHLAPADHLDDHGHGGHAEHGGTMARNVVDVNAEHARPADHSRDAGVDDQEEAAHAHVTPPVGGWTHTLPSFVAPGVLLAAFLLALVNFFRMRGADLHGPIIETYFSWIPVGDLQIDAALLLDPLSMLMVLIVTGVGFLIHLFSVGYMSHDPGYPRYMAYLNLFVFFMLTLVLGASYPLMFVGWEGVGLCSYLLIGFWFAESANADAGKKAFIVNRIGDFGFLMAMMLLFANVGTLSFPAVFEAAAGQLPYAGAVVTAVALFLFLGATGKSAQIPLYVWLPDAMAGPTPVSALIHAATMVTAGVYMIVRSSTIFAMAPTASLLVAVVGTLTALFAATIGLKQWDIKKVLAYSTVSQLGFMVAAVGMGAYVAGVFHLMTHAFFKACLFLGSGAVIHAMHGALHATHSHRDAQDMRNMGGLRRFLPITFATMGVATLAIAGVPPFAGFFSKDEIVGAAWLGAEGASPFSEASLFGVSGATWMLLIGVVLTITAFITAFYMGRMMLYTFFGPNRTGDPERHHLHEVGWTMSVPLVILALLSLIGGWFNVEPEVPIVNWFTPVAIGGPAALHGWLHPAIEGAEAVYAANGVAMAEAHHYAWPIILAIVVGLAGLLLAVVLLKPGRLGTAEEHPAYTGGLDRLLYHKWYVDELYDSLVVRPVYALSRGFNSVVDRGLIDGIVDGSGRLVQGVGLMFGRVQTGQLNTYAFMILVGVIAVLGAFVAL